MKTSELKSAALDWAVAMSLNQNPGAVSIHQDRTGSYHVTLHGERGNYSPSTDWAHGGPIIHLERISVLSDYREVVEGWLAESYDSKHQEFGTTPLEAACRCYVASKFGDEVQLPQELQ